MTITYHMDLALLDDDDARESEEPTTEMHVVKDTESLSVLDELNDLDLENEEDDSSVDLEDEEDKETVDLGIMDKLGCEFTRSEVNRVLKRSWMKDASCRNMGPDLFFLQKGETTEYATTLCQGCKVRKECLEFALILNERFGIWGGTSVRTRRKLCAILVERLGPKWREVLDGWDFAGLIFYPVSEDSESKSGRSKSGRGKRRQVNVRYKPSANIPLASLNKTVGREATVS